MNAGAATWAVVNPAAAAGQAGKSWAAIEAALRAAIGELTAVFSRARGDVAAQVWTAVAAGASRIVVAGGDGTLHEAVQGLMASATPDAAALGFVPIGTGCDFGRSFGVTNVAESIARLRTAVGRRIDVGRVVPLGGDHAAPAYFINVASAGVSGNIVRDMTSSRSSRSTRLWRVLGARAGFFAASAFALSRYRFPRVRIRVGDVFDDCVPLAVLAVANGRAFGGGMLVAPHAAPDDGVFDVVIVRGGSRLALMRDLRLIYAGAHLTHPLVTVVRGGCVQIEVESAGDDALIECDGELWGSAGAQFTLLPAALRILV
jgi:YegS/Rv2252/BmrU family lipid kinase